MQVRKPLNINDEIAQILESYVTWDSFFNERHINELYYRIGIVVKILDVTRARIQSFQ